jgi:lipopolysaccharide/colanic/teichoic acid biosynthesis glycosyltransferase
VRKISEVWASVRVAMALGKVGSVGRLQSPERLDAAIRLEQARVDRHEHAFSLVLFDTGNLEANGTAVQSLVHSLLDRIRSTDEIGWFDVHRIGVLLPYTPRDGAQKFVDDVRQPLDADALAPEYTIYTYPSQWYSDNGSGQSGQLHFADICRKWSSPKPQNSPALPRHNISTHSPSAPKPSTAGPLETYEESMTALKPMLRCPLPIWKRTMDILGASFGLTLFSPYLLLHTLIVKTISPGPVFFRQQRIGYLGRPFTMWKLRTMDVGVDTSYHRQHVSQLISGANKRNLDKPMTKLDYDPQMIPGAMILRKLCLDEMPQLINVLRGEMSLVGPRPPLTYEVEEFLKWQHRRFDVLPGMTGLWQVSGKNRLTFSKMVRLDIQYSRRKSLWLDLIILLKTPSAIIAQIRDSLVLQRERRRLVVEGENA